ncbi:uncharacterized protein [Epargyreus clarus]|uniref:uncharacterized protein n=1 Tax=Epargyreus clarus TaxID=520877 RepID=UPI003C2F68F3
MDQNYFNISRLPKDPQSATKYFVEILLQNVYPLLQRISNKIQLRIKDGTLDESILFKIRDVYSLCSNQIKKCVLNLLDVFKHEHNQQLCLQESRQYILERLICCFEKLYSIEECLLESGNSSVDTLNSSLLITTMYFVNWIDQTFEILNKMSTVVYRTDYKESDEIYEEWKNEVVECVSELHTSIDELLLSAMTLCRYCLPSDQPIVKVRCQVVLRETKALLSDVIEGDLDAVFHATTESLKLPIKPSNTNLLIDVLKDVLYVLETNTNTALLALLVHCFSHSTSLVEVLRNHLKSKKDNMCPCNVNYDDVAESCVFVKDFDLYNERLLQIGSFAISCSSDQKRVLSLKSGLASLEALDPHLVPALMMSPNSTHSDLLIDSWNQEISEIKNNVFLIVDPIAFSDRVKQMMHQLLLDVTKENGYNNSKVCAVINIGCTVCDFFNIYNKYEPEALEQNAELVPLLKDLNKVQLECKVVSNMLSSGDDFVYDTNKSKSLKEVTFAQLLKRLKLLFTLVSRINALISPKDNDQHFYEDDPTIEDRNMTHTLYGKNGCTYINSPRKRINTISRSIFTRTANIRSSTAKYPLSILTKNLKVKQFKDLSFSVKLDEICDSSYKSKRSKSILYNSPMQRCSLRKAVLSRQCKAVYKDRDVLRNENAWESSAISEKGSLMDATTSLQITEVLNQINDLTNLSTVSRLPNNPTVSINQETFTEDKDIRSNILRLTINNENTAKFKHVWNISVNSSESNVDSSQASNITLPSNVTTLERINDLEFVENKLNELKMRRHIRKLHSRRRTRFLLGATIVLAFSTYINQVVGLESDAPTIQWPSMPRRNIAALAREGYLRSPVNGLKRSISTLAKNGQLPTFRSPYDETDKQEEDDESPDKRNMASIARLRSYSTMKRNIQALARDGHRFGRGQYSQPNEKRNIAALARNGLIHKKDEIAGDEYYYPFYQNPIPPLSEIDGPYDFNEMYDFQQSVNPDMFPPLSRVLKRSDVGIYPNMFVPNQMDSDGYWNLKRGSVGLPALGLYRPIYTDNNNRNKRSVLLIPDVIDKNDIDEDSEDYENESDDKRSVDEDYDQQTFVKRHIGSLARYGLLPTFRYSGGRYSRSGRARLLLPSQEYLPYRKYPSNENVQTREYISNTEDDASIDAGDDTYISPPAIPAHPHPTGRYFHRALSNEVPPSNSPSIPPPLTLSHYEAMTRNRWQPPKEPNKFYYFRSLKVPHHTSGKRYLLLPAVDKAIRKSYRNSSLPSRRKNL